MRSLRARPTPGHRFSTGLLALAASVAVSVSSCTVGDPESGAAGPPRLHPEPRHDVASEMIASRSAQGERLNACELLGLTTAEIIDLTAADMPDVEPTGSGDLGLLCTYGGPGSPERYEAVLAGEDPDTADGFDVNGEVSDDDDDDGNGNGNDADAEATTDADAGAGLDAGVDAGVDAGAAADGTDQTTAMTATPDSPAFDPDIVPDTFAAGVVEPPAGAYAALAGQAALLGVRYACSEVRGPAAVLVEGAAPGAPEAPAAVSPELQTAYIDCVAAPAGGGVEVHTILASGDQLWHITLIRPETPRAPANESDALAGLHRVAEEILA